MRSDAAVRSVLSVAGAGTVVFMMVECGWLVSHYIFPGADPMSRRSVHLLVFYTFPVVVVVGAAFLALATGRDHLGKGLASAWTLWALGVFIGGPLWILSWIA